MGEGKRRRRRRVEPTEEWEQLALLCRWPEQLAYEEIRPLALFGLPVAERAAETGSSERTLYRKMSRFDEEGMDGFLSAEGARRRALPPAMRRFVVDLKAEHPPMRPHEISTVCYVRFSRRPDYRTVERVLSDEPMPLRMVGVTVPFWEFCTVRRFPTGRDGRLSSSGYRPPELERCPESVLFKSSTSRGTTWSLNHLKGGNSSS